MTGSFEKEPPYKSVIVATDGSTLSRTALVGGSMLATDTSAELHVFHAATGNSELAAVAQVVELLGSRPHKMVVRDVVGSAASTIAQYADEEGKQAIVVLGTHGRAE